jgi:lactam utilization protein B
MRDPRLMTSGGVALDVAKLAGVDPEAAERLRGHIAALEAVARTAAAELRHTYGHVALGQSINPDLVARAIRLLEEAVTHKEAGA